MKVRNLINKLLDSDMDAEVFVSTGDTFDDVSDFTLSWGGPNSADGTTISNTKFVYINLKENNENYK